jgi:branched-chain amino acid transport system permease protein
MERFLNLTLGGLSVGVIYAASALALVLIWRATRIVNFAQAGMMVVTTMIARSVLAETGSYWLGLAAALLAGLVLGALVERLVIRPVEGGPPLNAVIVTLGLLIVLQAGAGIVWGGEPRSYPPAFGVRGYRIGDLQLAFSSSDLFGVGAVLLVMALLAVLFNRTSTGLRMRAAAFAPETARVLGVRVGRTLTLGWALAAMVGALAGVLVAPATFVSPHSFDPILVFGFTAAVLGGLDAPVGAVVGGLALGLLLTYLSGYAGSDVVTLGALAVLVVVLLVRPNGLFAGSAGRRV